jgi:sugar/nucleoside kinase (ribokinase family)
MARLAALSRKLCPSVVGTGLVALDVVLSADQDSNGSLQCFAGGTCGNVLTILGYLGWKASPVGRLSPGPAAERVLADLRHWKVSSDFLSVDADGSTPIIIQRIGRRATGQPYHSFSWRCPACGAHLPGYKPVLATVAQHLAERLPAAQVFFFDRVSRGSLHLAKKTSENGAVVVFEPSGIGDPGLFREAWALAHVVKYSHERLRDIADLDLKPSEREGVLLEIETLGEEGLRYRSRLPKNPSRGWNSLPVFPVPDLKDAAGAGDWCTAGLLNKLARGGLTALKKATSETLREAFQYGQALAAWNCGFEGARGGMYEVDLATFHRQVDRILEGGEFEPLSLDKQDPELAQLLARLCPACEKADTPVRAHRRTGSNG